MEGERRASQARSSGFPARGADGGKPGSDSPFLGSSSGSSALLQAEVLDLDEDEDDLEVFSKVRAVASPGKVLRQLWELAPLCGRLLPAHHPSSCRGPGLEVGAVIPGCGTPLGCCPRGSKL